jgi:hypothetical protein
LLWLQFYFKFPNGQPIFLPARLSVNQGFCDQNLGQRLNLIFISFETFYCTIDGKKQVAKINLHKAFTTQALTSLFVY